MNIEKFKKNATYTAVALLFTSMISGAGYAVYSSNKSMSAAKKEPVNALAEFQRQDAEYQKRITSFNRDQYDMPVAALSRVPKNETCTNGIGGQLPEILPGMFDAPLYHLDAESVETEIDGEYAFAPYVTAYAAVGDILFKKPLDFFDRKIITQEELTRNFSDLQTVIGTRAFKNSFQTMEHKSGFPQAYISQQAGSTVTLTAFNNTCVKGVGEQNMSFRRVDLSGTPIYQLLSAKHSTTLHHGMNGLYNYTVSTPDFVSSEFFKWAKSNNRVYLEILKGKAVFPKGSIIYIPSTVEQTEETVTVNFKAAPLSITKDTWLKELAKEQRISIMDVSLIAESFPEFTIYKAIKNSTGDRISEMVVIEKDGKVYAGEWRLPSKSNISGDEPDRNNLVLMNETALKASLDLFKSSYQGAKVDVGTENENLDVRYEKAQSEGDRAANQYKEIMKYAGPAQAESKVDNSLETNTIPLK